MTSDDIKRRMLALRNQMESLVERKRLGEQIGDEHRRIIDEFTRLVDQLTEATKPRPINTK